MAVFHVIDSKDADKQIRFHHIKEDAEAGTWTKEMVFCYCYIKINLFLEGDFSVIVDDHSYRPTYGDICVLQPYKMHCGLILNQTHLDYYELNVGIKSLDHISDGNKLIEALIDNSHDRNVIFRPSSKDVTTAQRLVEKLEHALGEHQHALALAYTIEILALINSVYTRSNRVSPFFLNKLTQNTIRCITENFASEIKIDQLADSYGVSASYLSRIFKKDVGMGIHEYLTKYRILQASYLLKAHSVTETAFLCGFSESSYFISVFKKHFGCTPMAYKQSQQKSDNNIPLHFE